MENDSKEKKISVTLYQMSHTNNNLQHLYAPYAAIAAADKTPQEQDYTAVYKTEVTSPADEETAALLERIYCDFNISKPDDYRGRSLSVSDVIVLKDQDNEAEAYYIDPIGCVKLNRFFKTNTTN